MMLALILKFGRPLGLLLIVFTLMAGFKFWLAGHDRAVLAAYVTLSETTAAAAQAAEAERQAAAAMRARNDHARRLAAAQAAEALARADLEKGIHSYEQRLMAAKRACLLDDRDIDSILRHH